MIRHMLLLMLLAIHVSGAWPMLKPELRQRLATAVIRPDIVPVSAEVRPAPTVPGAIPVPTNQAPLRLPVKAGLAIDLASGTVLYSQDATVQLPIASITKMATALVILSEHELDETVDIPVLPEYPSDAELLGLKPGERYQMGALLEALLIQSANDAADALAIADAGSIPKFAAKMNLKLSQWGIEGARFTNPSGLIDTGNYATADSLSKMARLVLANAFLRQTIAGQSSTITSSAGRSLNLNTTNRLLSGGQFYGIKTGYTLAAGECFVGLTRINGHEVVTVVLGAADRFGNTQTLANWIGTNWQWL